MELFTLVSGWSRIFVFLVLADEDFFVEVGVVFKFCDEEIDHCEC